jgi:hypothetical protein
MPFRFWSDFENVCITLPLVGHVQLNLIRFFTGFGFTALVTASSFDVFAWDLVLATEDLFLGNGLISVERFDLEGARST